MLRSILQPFQRQSKRVSQPTVPTGGLSFGRGTAISTPAASTGGEGIFGNTTTAAVPTATLSFGAPATTTTRGFSFGAAPAPATAMPSGGKKLVTINRRGGILTV